MRKIILLMPLVIIFILALPRLSNMPNVNKAVFNLIKHSPKITEGQDALSRVGERITYDVKFGNVYLGKAKFNHLARIELGGKPVNLMTFETRLARFSDIEKIYSDPKSLLPIKVERDISTWPLPEKITEYYDQAAFTLTIKKIKGSKKERSFIQKNSPIHNAILLPYFVRDTPKLDIGWVLKVRLPTQEFEIRLVAIDQVKVPGGEFKAYRFASIPARFEIWITADERRIPVKIKGSLGLGYTLLMKEYSL